MQSNFEPTPKVYTIEIYDTERRGGSDCVAAYSSNTPFMGVHAGDLIMSAEYGLTYDGDPLRVVEVEHIFSEKSHKLLVYVEPVE